MQNKEKVKEKIKLPLTTTLERKPVNALIDLILSYFLCHIYSNLNSEHTYI